MQIPNFPSVDCRTEEMRLTLACRKDQVLFYLNCGEKVHLNKNVHNITKYIHNKL
jgi:hypothetical protein